ncbi:MAG: AsmA-like C-terminal region-containing protein, partial [Burkholderiaceae bacterium]
VEGRILHNVVMGGSRDGRIWRSNGDADELSGYMEYRQPQAAGAGLVYARLARLNIAAAAAGDVEALLEQQPDSIPALDIVVDDLELRGKRFGRVEIDAANRGAGAVQREGGVREWRLNKFNVYMPEATFTASGNWASVNAQPLPPGQRPGPRAAGERRRTVMNFRLDINDSGELLGRIGMKDVIRRGKGRLEGQVAWLGSPLSLDYPTMTGQLNVNVESGQFLKADPGLAKLLGVLSLQSLPRRLTLDFRDVFSAGFAFDFVRGDVTITNGIASTNNLQMKGVNAAVLMEGRADIARETQDLKVVVIPELNAGTASLVAAAINPAIGLGTFLAQMFLRRPLIEAATQEFHIDGTWADPKITKMAKTPR